MKITFFSLVLLFTVVACNSAPSESAVSAESNEVIQLGGSISVTAFEQKMKLPGIQILDVRTAGEYQGGHFNNALQANWLDQREFADRVQHIDKAKPVLVYCASGVRSAEAMNWMKENGFKEVSNLKGGISAWRMEGKPLESKATRAEMSMAAFNASTKSGTILVDIGAEWCPPCVKMEPVLQQLQKEKSAHFSLVKVDGGIDIEVMKQLRSEGLPTFIVFKNGKETWRKQGIVDYATLAAAIQ
ncbi:rhodanese-like domain-containing protein [Sediminibacterium sp.]|uniref:rhodanese-like domain-containing protein n=1 Tax=Sediminibacterium sp. TaxID=1917865 RepID=UPI003F713AC5